MNPLIRRLVEMPVDTGGEENYIPRERKQKLAQRATGHDLPAAPEPGAFPTPREGEAPIDPTVVQTHHELLASEGYTRIIKKLKVLLGDQMPVGPRAPGQITGLYMNAVGKVMRWEQGHERQLEQAAIRLVLSFPDFESIKRAYERGDLKIKAKLTHNVNKGDASLMPEEPSEEMKADLEIAEIAQELNAEVLKRRMINTMIQGAGIGADQSFNLIRDELNQINPQIVNAYGLIMAGAELDYWTRSDANYLSVAGGPAAGIEELTFEEETGIPVIRAEAMVFPVLVQEITKGIMTFLGHADDNENVREVEGYAKGQANTLSAEQEDINIGPPLWRQITRQFPEEDRKYMPWVFRELTALSPNNFKRVMHQLAQGAPEGKQFVLGIIQKIKAQNAAAGHDPFAAEGGGENALEGPEEPPEAPPEDDENPDPGENPWESSPARALVNRLLD